MPSLNQNLGSPETGSRHARWIVIAVLIAAAVVGLVLVVAYGGGSSGPGY